MAQRIARGVVVSSLTAAPRRSRPCVRCGPSTTTVVFEAAAAAALGPSGRRRTRRGPASIDPQQTWCRWCCRLSVSFSLLLLSWSSVGAEGDLESMAKSVSGEVLHLLIPPSDPRLSLSSLHKTPTTFSFSSFPCLSRSPKQTPRALEAGGASLPFPSSPARERVRTEFTTLPPGEGAQDMHGNVPGGRGRGLYMTPSELLDQSGR